MVNIDHLYKPKQKNSKFFRVYSLKVAMSVVICSFLYRYIFKCFGYKLQNFRGYSKILVGKAMLPMLQCECFQRESIINIS